MILTLSFIVNQSKKINALMLILLIFGSFTSQLQLDKTDTEKQAPKKVVPKPVIRKPTPPPPPKKTIAQKIADARKVNPSIAPQVTTTRIEPTKTSISEKVTNAITSDGSGRALFTAKACISGLAGAIPPSFCYKTGGDAGVIPTGCPEGYFRSLALCYENCRPGYTFVAGVCWAGCEDGYRDHGLSCYKSFLRWYFKHSYFPSSITNFSDRIPCPGAMYRGGALCYRNCATLGMYNCGIGACVSDPESCATEILGMLLQIGDGIATGVATIASFGTASGAVAAAKVSTKAAIHAVKKSSLKLLAKTTHKTIKKLLKSTMKKQIMKRAWKKTKKSLLETKDAIADTVKDMLKDRLKEAALANVCEQVWAKMIQNNDEMPSLEDLGDKLIDSVDFIGAKGAYESCSATEEDSGLGCAQAIIDIASAFDPSGLLTIASAFMKPTCDVPVDMPSEDLTAE